MVGEWQQVARIDQMAISADMTLDCGIQLLLLQQQAAVSAVNRKNHRQHRAAQHASGDTVVTVASASSAGAVAAANMRFKTSKDSVLQQEAVELLKHTYLSGACAPHAVLASSAGVIL